jgi:hypothetical protein
VGADITLHRQLAPLDDAGADERPTVRSNEGRLASGQFDVPARFVHQPVVTTARYQVVERVTPPSAQCSMWCASQRLAVHPGSGTAGACVERAADGRRNCAGLAAHIEDRAVGALVHDDIKASHDSAVTFPRKRGSRRRRVEDGLLDWRANRTLDMHHDLPVGRRRDRDRCPAPIRRAAPKHRPAAVQA